MTMMQAGPSPSTIRFALGNHLCCIYHNDEEHRALLTTYLAEGLQQHQKVVYIVDAHRREEILGYLRNAHCDPTPYLDSGQLSVVTAGETYLPTGRFDPDRVLALLRASTDAALAQGYSGLRITGEMTWVLRNPPGSSRLIEYEAKLNLFFKESSCIGLCQYDCRQFSPAMLRQVLMTHPLVVVGTVVCDNFYYLPAEEYLGHDSEAAEVRHQLENLVAHKQAEKTARRLASIVKSTDDAVIGKTLDGEIVDWNTGAERIYGYSAQEAIGQHISFLAPADREQEFSAIIAKLQRGERVEHQDTVRIRKDGRQIAVSLTISPVMDSRGTLLGISTIARDVTEHKRTQRELELSEQRFRSLVTATSQLVWGTNAAGEVDDIPGWRAITGQSVEDVKGWGWSNALHPEDRERTIQVWTKAVANRTLYDTEYRVRRSDGTYCHLAARGVPVLNEDGTIREWVGTCSDISERKQAEQQQLKAALYVRSLIEASLDPLVTISKDGRIMDVNEATEHATGISRDRLIGTDFSDYFTDPQKARRGYEEVFAQGFVRDYELALRHTSARVTDVLYNAAVFRNEAGEIERSIRRGARHQ